MYVYATESVECVRTRRRALLHRLIPRISYYIPFVDLAVRLVASQIRAIAKSAGERSRRKREFGPHGSYTKRFTQRARDAETRQERKREREIREGEGERKRERKRVGERRSPWKDRLALTTVDGRTLSFEKRKPSCWPSLPYYTRNNSSTTIRSDKLLRITSNTSGLCTSHFVARSHSHGCDEKVAR